MQLTKEQLEQYEEQGFLLISACFSQEEVAVVRDRIPALMTDNSVVKVWEEDKETLRAIVGIQDKNFFGDLLRHPYLLESARKLCASELYVGRSKITMKKPFTGGAWLWHQDSAYAGRLYEFSPSSQGMVAMLFLNEVNEFNCPLYLIPGSHKEGVIEHETQVNLTKRITDKANFPVGYGSKLPYKAANETISKLVENKGIVAAKGVAGSVLFFNVHTFHASNYNISPFARDLLSVLYLSLEPQVSKNEMSEVLGRENCTPLQTLSKKEVDHLFNANLATTPI
jgi:ectoine hydroxylase